MRSKLCLPKGDSLPHRVLNKTSKNKILVPVLVGSIISMMYLESKKNKIHASEKPLTKLKKKQKEKLKRIFSEFASLTDEEGNKLMTPEDFIRCVILVQHSTSQSHTLEEGHSAEKMLKANPTLELLFKMADTNKAGKIKFQDFVLLFNLLTTPQSDFQLAFRLFDTKKDGCITKDEFQRVMGEHSNIRIPFDMNCDLMKTFFGPDGNGRLSYIQFSQFLESLDDEIRKQEFRGVCDSDGKITGEQFIDIVFSQHKGVLKQKDLLLSEKIALFKGKIGYPEFMAFNKIVKHNEIIASAFRHASTLSEDGSITRDNFRKATQRVARVTLSPLEIDLIFSLFSRQSDNTQEVTLKKEDYEEFLKATKVENENRTKVLDLWLRDQSFTYKEEKLSEASFSTRLYEGFKTLCLRTLYGAIAGGIGAAAVYPIDLVKTRMQNQRQGQILYKSSIDCFKQVINKEGVKGLYRGLGPQLVGVAPEKAIKLAMNDLLRDLFERKPTEEELKKNNNKQQIDLPLEILAGCGAGASQVVFTNPIEIVKIRLQTGGETAILTGEKPKGAIQICKELGFAGLYRGASACFLRDIPFSGIYFPTYTKFKEVFKTGDTNSPTDLLLAGSVSGAIAASSTTPIDVVKTRLQVEARAGQQTYKNIPDCFVKVYKQEGWKAFYKGVVPRTCRSSPQFGVTLLSYEILQRYWKPETENKVKVGNESSSTMVGNVPVDDEDLQAFRNLYVNRTNRFRNLFGKKKVEENQK